MAQPADLDSFSVIYSVPRRARGWELPEEKMPESVVHDNAVALLRAMLSWWAARSGRDALVARNLAVRWDRQHPNVGVDPDVSLFEPAPPDAGSLTSVRTWLEGHAAPVVAIEVVSDANPHKDYAIAPDKYAASGTGELWVFDPKLRGPSAHGGPFRIQLWQRNAHGALKRSYAGDGPVLSPHLGAHLIASGDGQLLRIADDAAGARPWLTAEEAERAEKEAERAEKEAERAEKEAALARVAALEAELAKRT